MNIDNIPNELKVLERWVIWKSGKVPYDAKDDGAKASAVYPDTWSTFAQAVDTYEKCDDAHGIGFVLNGDGVVGIDIDDCFDIDDGAINSAALEILDQLGAQYISITPSGKGLRAFGYAAPILPTVRRIHKGLAFELYSDARYLTITDQVIRCSPLCELRNLDLLYIGGE